ncbi:hypothetical protein ACX4ZB_06810 [Aerococcus urinae]
MQVIYKESHCRKNIRSWLEGKGYRYQRDFNKGAIIQTNKGYYQLWDLHIRDEAQGTYRNYFFAEGISGDFDLYVFIVRETLFSSQTAKDFINSLSI